MEIAYAAGKPIMAMQIGNDTDGFALLLAVIAEVASGPRVAVCIGAERAGAGEQE